MSTSSSTTEPLTPTELDVTKPRSDPSALPEPKPHRKRRKVTPAQDLTAGALASSVSRFMIAPLDVLKIRFQIQDHRQKKYTGLRQAIKTIYTEEGLRAFWKGNLAAELMVVPYGAVSFLAYQQFKSTVDHLEILPHTPGWEHILCLSAGSFSGFASTVATYPLDLLRTRLAAQREPKVYRTLSAAFIHILRNDGIKGLYVGMWPTLVGIVPNMALQFGLYEGMKSTLARFRKLQKHPMQSANVPAIDQSRTSSLTSSSPSTSTSTSSSPSPESSSSSTLSLDIPASSISMSSTPTGDVKTVTTMSLQWGVDVADAHDPHAHPHADRPRPRHHRSSKPFPEMGGAMLTLAVQFGCGFIAGVLSKLLTMPLDVIKKRYQVTGFPLAANSSSLPSLPPMASNATPEQPYKGVWDCGKRIVKYEGIRGLFKGSIPSLIKAGPNSALIFVVYEASLQLFDRLGWKTMH